MPVTAKRKRSVKTKPGAKYDHRGYLVTTYLGTLIRLERDINGDLRFGDYTFDREAAKRIASWLIANFGDAARRRSPQGRP